MYLIIGVAILILLLRTFDLLPKLENKFWRYLDSLIIGVALLILLSRLNPLLVGMILTLGIIYAYRKGFFTRPK
jgi:hypothetical protein